MRDARPRPGCSGRCTRCSRSRSRAAARARPSGTPGRSLFPGLRPGERLSRHVSSRPARRAPGERRHAARRGPGPDLADPRRRRPDRRHRSGRSRPPTAASYAAQGYPPDAKVGLDGLERIFQAQLAGNAGRHAAGRPPRCSRAPRRQARPRRPHHDQPGDRAGGDHRDRRALRRDAAMDPRTGGAAGAGGRGVLGPAAARLDDEDHHRDRRARGGDRQAHRHVSRSPARRTSTATCCTTPAARFAAGTFLNAFAVSCNSVFAPLGAKLGAKRLVDVAERFGFNQLPSIPGAAESQIPSASEIGSDTGGRLVGDRPGQGAGHRARDDRRRGARSRWAAAGRCRRSRPTSAPASSTSRARHGSPAGAEDDDRRGASSGPARPRRSRA